MAENAANFTKTFQIRPNILEVIAQKSLNDTLFPAFERICIFLAESFPHKFGWLNLWNEETFSVVNGLLEYHYLKQYDASFSENFYGLKRITGNGSKLDNSHRNLSFLFLVILPYLRRKLKRQHYILQEEHAERSIRKNITGYCKLIVLHSYSTLEVVWVMLTIYHFIAYMSSQTEFQTPLLRLQNIKLTYNMNAPENFSIWKLFSGTGVSLSQFLKDAVRKSLMTTLEVGAFFLQFMETWNMNKMNYDFKDLPKIPAPSLDSKSSTMGGKCPICYKFWTTPTVLQVSGYIFCFRCILKYLNQHQKCPVTNLPVKTLDIVRLYTI